MGFYAQVVVPLLCDIGLDRPFVARYRRELLAHASGTILEIGFGTGLNLPCYPPHVRKLTTVDPNVGMYRRARRRIKQAGVEFDQADCFQGSEWHGGIPSVLGQKDGQQ